MQNYITMDVSHIRTVDLDHNTNVKLTQILKWCRNYYMLNHFWKVNGKLNNVPNQHVGKRGKIDLQDTPQFLK